MLTFGKFDREHVLEWCRDYIPEVAACGGYANYDDILCFANDLLAAADSGDAYLYFIDPDTPLYLSALYKYVHSVSSQSVALADKYFLEVFRVLGLLAPSNAESVCNVIDMFICAANSLELYDLQLRFMDLRQQLGFVCELEML